MTPELRRLGAFKLGKRSGQKKLAFGVYSGR
jgi:hypothetical protein